MNFAKEIQSKLEGHSRVGVFCSGGFDSTLLLHGVFSAVQKNSLGKFVLYNNDPEEAHRVCGFASCKCYHFIKGRLYKCGPVALFPEFDQQFGFDLSTSDQELLHSYRPLAVEEFDQRGQQFLDQIDNVIPQCKFCPVPKEGENFKISAVSKKAGSTSIYD